jgi:hypothetical protein
MTLTITITHHQGEALHRVFGSCLSMADKSRRVAEALDITPMDVIRVTSVLSMIPRLTKIPKNGNDLPTLPSLVPTQHQVSGANNSTPSHADPSAAHGNT